MTDNLVATSVDDLKPKMKLTGTVTKVELFGAFVDIGVGAEGLVHISQLKPGRVNNVDDVISEGQEVEVWVRRVDKEAGRIELTMIEPHAVGWEDLEVGQAVKGKVVRLEKYGAFVEIGASRPGLVHVSELAAGYVGSPSDVVTIGEEVEVKIIGLNRKRGRIDLSIKALLDEMPVEEEQEEEPLTAFALAYQRALDAEKDEESLEEIGDIADLSDRQRRQQDELLARTLEQHKDRE